MRYNNFVTNHSSISDDVMLRDITFRQIGGGYQEQYSRPHDVSGNRDDVNRAIDAVSEQWLSGGSPQSANGLKYATASTSAISMAAANLISPSAETYTSTIGLRERAWGEDRFVFWAVFETKDDLVDTRFFRYIISGYTDSEDGIGLSHTGNYLDPALRMFVNSVIKLEIKMVPNGYGGYVEQCKTIYHDELHFSSLSDAGLRSSSRERDHLLRPTDIMDICQMMALNTSTLSSYGPSDDYLAPASTISIPSNRIGYANKKLNLAKTENNSSSGMLSNILRGLSIGRAEADRRHAAEAHNPMHITDGTEYSIYSNAKCTAPISESTMAINGQYILSVFRERLGMGHQPYIVYKDFVRLFPNAEASNSACRISLMHKTGTSRYGIYDSAYAKDSCNMRGASPEQIEAFRIATCISNIMFSNGFVELRFIATNETLSGQWDIRPLINDDRGMVSFRTTDYGIISNDWDIFCNSLCEQALIPAVTTRGGFTRDISVEISADLMTDTRITIRLDGGVNTPFVFPSFASANYSPVRYRSEQGRRDERLEAMGNVFTTLSDSVAERYESRNYVDKTITGARTKPSRYSY